MADASIKKLRIATIVFWILLLYVIAALVWWAVLLMKEADIVYELRKENLSRRIPDQTSRSYQQEIKVLEEQRRRDVYKYLGEGLTFLLLILIGAVYLYRSVRRQFRLHRQQQNFVMAITHELKTPIAVSKLNLETLQKYQLEEEKKEQLIRMTLQETLRLDSLINNILISSQLEDDDYKVTKQELNLSALISDVLNQFSSRYAGRKIESEIEDDLDIEGDPLLLKLLVSNLLENAQKYSPSNKVIKCILRKGETIKLQIIDEGPGIPDEEKGYVFEKFYRIGTEQTRQAQGTGLGLYLCKKIVKDHQGEISIVDNTPEGSIFIVQFPVITNG